MLVHVLGDVTQPVHPLARGGVRQLGLLELLLDVSRAEAEVEASATEVTQRRNVAGQQRGPVEARVQHEGATRSFSVAIAIAVIIGNGAVV